MFNIHDITISSDFFGQDKVLADIVGRRFNLVFGRNGCGKSTIASAIDDYAKGKDATAGGPSLQFDAPLSDEERNRIFVFNEQFVRNNVELVNQGGIDAIVMLGQAINDDKDIKENEKIKNEADETLEKQKDVQTAAQMAMVAALTTMEDKVNKADPSYSTYHRDAHGRTNRKKADLERDIFPYMDDPRIATLNVADLVQQVSTEAQRLKAVSQGSRIQWSAPTFALNSLLEQAKSLLQQRVEKPELSEREALIVSLMQHEQNITEATRHTILDTRATFCPYCQQDIAPGHLDKLAEQVARIETLLQDKARDYRQDVNNLLDRIVTPCPDFSALAGPTFSVDVSNCRSALAVLETQMSNLRERLKRRLTATFEEPLPYDSTPLEQAAAAYNNAIGDLTKSISKYNDDVDKIKQQLKDFDQLNALLACCTLKADYNVYRDQKGLFDEATRQIEEASKTSKECAQKLHELKLRANQSNYAMDYINTCLSYIFFSTNRLSLQALSTGDGSKGQYRLLSHGHPVPPDKVSLGERNAIGLAYFFAKSFEGLAEGRLYNTASFFVIDDPISSFDRGNRVGVITFLKEQFLNILNGNEESKVLILSHDMRTINDLNIVAKELGRNLNMDDDEQKEMEDYPYMELSNRSLFHIGKFAGNTYERLLGDVYAYATASPSSDVLSVDDSIGNRMRRLMETYSSFSYGLGFTDMLRNEDVLSQIQEEGIRHFYSRLSVNLLLNEESHADNRTDPSDPTDTLYSSEEKQNLARYLLYFIYLTNPTHLKRLLRNEMVSTIASWKEQIPNGILPTASPIIANGKTLDELIADYSQNEFVIEVDEYGTPHCGLCEIHGSAYYKKGRRATLDYVHKNTNRNTCQRYPLFAKYNIIF